jgi:hypothetical protein
MGGVAGWLCYATNETGRLSYPLKCALTGSALGAIGGAGAGAGVDMLFTRAPAARVRVRF